MFGAVICLLWSRVQSLRIRQHCRVMKCFAIELMNLFDHSFVDHNGTLEKLPSIDAFGVSEAGLNDEPSFSQAPTVSAFRMVQ